MVNISRSRLEELLEEINSEITFESEILDEAPTMSLEHLNIAIDERIKIISDKNTNIEVKERMEKEARKLACMLLRK